MGHSCRVRPEWPSLERAHVQIYISLLQQHVTHGPPPQYPSKIEATRTGEKNERKDATQTKTFAYVWCTLNCNFCRSHCSTIFNRNVVDWFVWLLGWEGSPVQFGCWFSFAILFWKMVDDNMVQYVWNLNTLTPCYQWLLSPHVSHMGIGKFMLMQNSGKIFVKLWGKQFRVLLVVSGDHVFYFRFLFHPPVPWKGCLVSSQASTCNNATPKEKTRTGSDARNLYEKFSTIRLQLLFFSDTEMSTTLEAAETTILNVQASDLHQL